MQTLTVKTLTVKTLTVSRSRRRPGAKNERKQQHLKERWAFLL